MRYLFFGVVVVGLASGCGGTDDPLFGLTTGSGGAHPSKGGADAGAKPDEGDGGTLSSNDSGSAPPSPVSPGADASSPTPTPPPATGPTWTSIYNAYLGTGTFGDCGSCHNPMSDPPSAYQWLSQKGYISGSNSTLVDPQLSPFSWFGGPMPPQGPTSEAQATSDLQAWVAAGAHDN